MYVLVNTLSVLINLFEVAELLRWFVDVMRSDDDMSERQVRAWEWRFTVIRLVSLGLNDIPIVALSFVVLLIDGPAIVVLMSICMASFGAGSKIDTAKDRLKKFFAAPHQHIPLPARPQRRFKTLRQVARHIMIARKFSQLGNASWTEKTLNSSCTKQFPWLSMSQISDNGECHPNPSSTKAELATFRKNLKALDPRRVKFLRKEARNLHIQMAYYSEFDGPAYFAYVRVYFDDAFTAQVDSAMKSQQSLCMSFMEHVAGNDNARRSNHVSDSMAPSSDRPRSSSSSSSSLKVSEGAGAAAAAASVGGPQRSIPDDTTLVESFVLTPELAPAAAASASVGAHRPSREAEGN